MMSRLGYLAGDRTMSQVARMFHSCGHQLPIDQFPYLSWQNSLPKQDSPSLDDLFDLFPQPRPQFLIVDALQTLMPSGKLNDYQEVMRYYAALKRFCTDRDVTLLGTVPTAKTGTGDDYHAPSPLGSVGWEHGAETTIRVELVDARQPEEKQGTMLRVYIRTRSARPATLWYDFDSEGRLVPALTVEDWSPALLTRLQAIPEGQPIPKRTFVTWGHELGRSETTIEGWLTDCIRRSVLERVKQGTYRRPYRT
jgi:hypothetical protein